MSKKQYKKGNNKKLSCHTQNFRRKPSVQTYAFLVGSPDWNRSGDCLGFVIGLFHHHIGTELGVEIGDGLFQQLSRILLHNGLIDGTLQRLDAKFLAKSFDGKARVELPRAQVDEISCQDKLKHQTFYEYILVYNRLSQVITIPDRCQKTKLN